MIGDEPYTLGLFDTAGKKAQMETEDNDQLDQQKKKKKGKNHLCGIKSPEIKTDNLIFDLVDKHLKKK